MKKSSLSFFIPLLFIIVISLIFSIFNLFNISIHPIFYLLSIILSSAFLGYITGIKSNEKGYLRGLAVGGIYVMLLFLISIIISRELKYTIIIYYIIIILSSTLSSMIGINKKN